MVDALKAEGNALFSAGKFSDAVEKFSEAIKLDPSNHVLYSNRSGSYASLKEFDKALDDAEATIKLRPDWAKGWTRKGAALHGLGKYDDASTAYNKALELEPNNSQAKSGIESAERAMNVPGFGGSADPLGIGNMLNDPSLLQKLAQDPRTSSLLADRDFMNKLIQIKQNPQMIFREIQDPRIMALLSTLMGINVSGGTPGQVPKNGSSVWNDNDQGGKDDSDSGGEKKTESTKHSKVEEVRDTSNEDAELDEEAKAKLESKKEAQKEKTLGNELYKKREFDEAIKHYAKAWELEKDISYLTNMGAAQFEKGDYKECIESCNEAVEQGRAQLADFKLIARAFGRIGAAYEKLGDLNMAIKNYESSLTEHRNPDILAKLRAAQKTKKLNEKNAYINPVEAEKARLLGQEKFKAADWPAAVEAYTEMIKRAPEDARGYSNRAACFLKLLEFPSAIQDCDEAIKKDPKFIKSYIRKAQALIAMREYNKAIDVCDLAEENDEEFKNYREIEEQRQKAIQAQFTAREGESEQETMERVQKDPEILKILQDPVMQAILQQSKNDPAALKEHLKNPLVRSSIQKLVAAGVIRLGR